MTRRAKKTNVITRDGGHNQQYKKMKPKRVCITMEVNTVNIGLLTNELSSNERNKKVTVEWTKPRFLDKTIPFDKKWYDGQLYNIGIYYISRTHGKNKTLLYIGQTSDSFYNRFIAHQVNWLYQVRGKIFVRFGYIIKPMNKPNLDIPQIIRDVESAIIYEMQPPYNSIGKNSYSPKHLYEVTNIRYKGELPDIISMRTHIIEL
jgi:hypothetical protein